MKNRDKSIVGSLALLAAFGLSPSTLCHAKELSSKETPQARDMVLASILVDTVRGKQLEAAIKDRTKLSNLPEGDLNTLRQISTNQWRSLHEIIVTAMNPMPQTPILGCW